MGTIQFQMSSTTKLLCFFVLFFSVSTQQSTRNLGIKPLNLGGWLVTEGWMKPSLFDDIPNNDFLDGNQLQFKSVTVNKYLCAELGGGSTIVVNRQSPSGWETFRLWRVDESTFQFRVFNQKFVGLKGIDAVAVADNAAVTETFKIERKSGDQNRVRIKAPNGQYLRVKTEEAVTADGNGDGGWGDNDPTVFEMTILARRMQGEFQLTNGIMDPSKLHQ